MTKYSGLSYEKASREAEKLIKRAAETGSWHAILDDLIELRSIMVRQRVQAA